MALKRCCNYVPETCDCFPLVQGHALQSGFHVRGQKIEKGSDPCVARRGDFLKDTASVIRMWHPTYLTNPLQTVNELCHGPGREAETRAELPGPNVVTTIMQMAEYRELGHAQEWVLRGYRDETVIRARHVYEVIGNVCTRSR
jgi:hypothetical protein